VSQAAGFLPHNFPGGFVQTITGNTGGPVPPAGGNINFVGDGTTITVAGSPSTNTLTISTGSDVATDYVTDSGTATPALGVLNIIGGTDVSTSGSGNTITITSSSSSGIVTLDADSGSATGSTVTISGGSTGLTTIASAATMDLTGTLIVANGGTGDSSFTAYAPIVGGTTTTGVLQSAATGISNSGYVLTSTGASSLPTWQASGGGGGITTINVDNSGSVTGTTIDLYAASGSAHAGGTVAFIAASATEIDLQVTTNRNTCIGAGTVTPSSGVANTALGNLALAAGAGSNSNSAFGDYALNVLSSGNGSNVGFGQGSLLQLTSGDSNVAIGNSAANAYTGSESSNIIIGTINLRTAGESNVLSIGNGTGTGQGNLNQAFICGIDGVALTTANVVTEVSNQLGTAVLTAGTNMTIDSTSTPNQIIFNATGGGGGGITTINVDNSGSVTGTTIDLYAASGSANNGQSVAFVAVSGTEIDLQITNNTSGNYNSLLGAFAGGSIPFASCSGNFGFGDHALNLLSSGSSNWNVAIGSYPLGYLTGGSGNVGIGLNAGNAYTGSESMNVLIGTNVQGTLGESNTLRIGAGTGTGNFKLNQAFISGIQGITVTGAAVLVSSSDQLGVAVSSRKYKENIEDMDSFSSDILKLKPKKFNYKGHGEKSGGLIAEEVHEVMPSLVVYDKQGDPQTVKYHELPALLLNELQKALKRINALELQVLGCKGK
jgi:hypothetical protein